MRTKLRPAPVGRTISPEEFERLLQRAEKFQKLHAYGPQVLAKPRTSPKRAAPAA